MRITLVISSLRAGGAERVMTNMANYWAEKGWQVTLLTLNDGTESPFYSLHPQVIWIPLGLAKKSTNFAMGIAANLSRVLTLRKQIFNTHPQIVISFMDKVNVLVLMATLGLGIPVAVSERINPTTNPIGTGWALLRSVVYLWASCLVVQTERTLGYFSLSVRRNARVIPNPIVLPDMDHQPLGNITKHKFNRFTIVAMGRLDKQKGFDLLIKAYAIIAPQHPDWSMVIWGEGPERFNLENLRDELGLHERILLPGQTQEPFVKLREADMFVLSSRYEGFPNVLLEALACGLAAVCFDCPNGPREIIRPGINGLLVPTEDIESLASAMEHLILDEYERMALAARARNVIERFGLEKIMEMWESLIIDLVERDKI